MRLDIRRVGALKDGDRVVGNRTRVKVVKNKMAPPFREVEFDILYGEGISHEGDLVDLGAECGAVEKSGAWFGFEGDRIGQGRENAKQYLRDHPDVARKIEAKVLAHPASVDSLPTSGGKEDHVSMGMTAALKLKQIVDNAEKVLAIELMTAAQGLEYRRPLKAATEIERALQFVRTLVPALEEDRVIAGDIERLAKGIRDGDFDSWSA